uniref:Methyltransferase type 11 domain-containing protein n=1 Tax=Arcella intermedia TaxID=1963864 RepID=A0A6B2LMK3_9EUKA
MFFTEQGYQVTGVDFSEGMIQVAKERCPSAHFLIQDIVNLQLGESLYDCAWMNYSLLHIQKSAVLPSLRTIARSLKAGGILSICTYLGQGEGLEQDQRYNGTPKYYSYFSQTELEEMVRSCGFSIIESTIEPLFSQYAKAPSLELWAKKS